MYVLVIIFTMLVRVRQIWNLSDKYLVYLYKCNKLNAFIVFFLGIFENYICYNLEFLYLRYTLNYPLILYFFYFKDKVCCMQLYIISKYK